MFLSLINENPHVMNNNKREKVGSVLNFQSCSHRTLREGSHEDVGCTQCTSDRIFSSASLTHDTSATTQLVVMSAIGEKTTEYMQVSGPIRSEIL